MKKIVIIGGMGSGKSTVCGILAKQGCPVIDLDELSHEVLDEPEIRHVLVDVFGDDILVGEGIDRSVLAAKAFQSEEATRALDNLVQPRVIQRCQRRLEALENAGAEAALIECSALKDPDILELDEGEALVVVTAPAEKRIARKTAMGFASADVRNRISRQTDEAQLIEWADYAIDNSGSLDELSSQVKQWWTQMQSAD